MNKKLCLAAALSLGFMTWFSGCGGSSLTSAYQGTVSWSATGQTITNTTLNMTLYQTSSTVTGQFVITGSTNVEPISGTITGTASGSTLTVTAFTILAGETYTTSAAGTFTGTLTLSGTTLSGSLTGTLNSAAATVAISATQYQ